MIRFVFVCGRRGGGNYGVRVSEVSPGGRGVAASLVPEQPHTDKPFLRPSEMMLECVGGRKGGGVGWVLG